MSLGNTLKRLRRERNMTQEELGALLSITPQAISRWENDSAMPDISQIVPLARVFHVSTDTLLGFCSDKDNESILRIIDEAREENELYSRYCRLWETRKRYPDHTVLLLELLECSVAIAYPENDCYDPIHAAEVYANCSPIFQTIISVADHASDILRARMIMAILHASYGNYAKAEEQLQHFPCRSDMTQTNLGAYMAHAKGDYPSEIALRKWEFLYLYEGMMDSAANLGKAYLENREYGNAIRTLQTALTLMEKTFEGEEYLPPLHRRDCGDMYLILAKAYLSQNDTESALSAIEKLCKSQHMSSRIFDGKYQLKMSLLYGIPVKWYKPRKSSPKELEAIRDLLKQSDFDSVRCHARYIQLAEEIEKTL